MIFAAGLGTRLRPLTNQIPKALVPINGMPLLHHLLQKLQQAGCSHVVINVHHHADQIIDFITSHDYGMRIDISDESDLLLDTGGGLRNAAAYFKGSEPILIHNVDILSNIDLKKLYEAHRNDELATVVVSSRNTSRYLLFNDNGLLRGWLNRTNGETKPPLLDTSTLHQAAFSGIHVVSPLIFELMRNFEKKFSIIDFYLQAMQQHAIRAYFPTQFAMLDVGKTDSLVAAETFIKEIQ